MLAFLAAPFVASLILTGIHAYLGVHVVERGVIFVDLSLAQIAALGATVAASVSALTIAWIAHRQLGGYTGDVLGAAVVVTECAVLALIR